MHETVDHLVPCGCQHGEAATEPPSFYSHARGEVGCPGTTFVSVACWNPVDTGKYGIANFIWNTITLPQTILHHLRWDWSHDGILFKASSQEENNVPRLARLITIAHRK
jgi:hypothetical protein